MDNNTIELWQAELQVKDFRDSWLLLDRAERRRSERFSNESARNHFVISRAIARQLIARILCVRHETIEFAPGQHGKPYIRTKGESSDLVFNQSHSGDRLAVVIGNRQRLGVDIERHRERFSYGSLVNKCFADSEREYWHALPAEQQQSAFYQFWTQKEAFVKAVGRGISLGLDHCVVAVDQPFRFLRIPEQYGDASDWRLIDLSMPEGFSGALSTDCGDVRIVSHIWES